MRGRLIDHSYNEFLHSPLVLVFKLKIIVRCNDKSLKINFCMYDYRNRRNDYMNIFKIEYFHKDAYASS